ncbi:MAG: hypothetical protein ACJ796_16390 [Gemmatimonadaceae bacterium]
MRRLIGSLLVVHGIAHAGAGIWTAGVGPTWSVTLLWWAAMVGFGAAGAGLIGVPRIDKLWRMLAAVAAIASILLIARYPHPVLLFGSAIDGAILILSIPWAREIVARQVGVPVHPPHRPVGKLGTSVAVIALSCATALVALRPWHMQWGVSSAELSKRFPGEQMVASANFRIDHGITIRAPADSVWPWLAQLGQDRAGFYSYSWLERMFGDPVHNANRVVPEWQSINVGDLVRAAPANYFGGAFGRDLGWRVVDVVPRRALVLEGWGTFVIVPVDDTTSRLLVRTRGAGKPSLSGVALAPLELLLFEPAHFIMERGMLRGIKQRAERARVREAVRTSTR